MSGSQLVAVCVGKTKELEINGEMVTTAYLKSEANGPVQIHESGVEGNDVAVHTDHIYAFSETNYPYWAEFLGVDVETWDPGHFAENFLVAELAEKNIEVGDVYEVGDQVRLSVSGPRIPCFKLCWRLGQPDTFISEFAVSGRGGVYFNVERTGVVEAGDEFRLVERSNSGAKINDIALYAFGAKQVTTDDLRRILALPGLSDISTLVLSNKLLFLEDQARAKVGRWTGWREMVVSRIDQETPEIKSFILEPIDDQPIAKYRAGQFLTIGLNIGDQEDEVVRVWSLSDYDDDAGQYRLSIKKEPHGLGSGHMHENVSVGDRLPVRAPMGRFLLNRGGFKPIILIAAGIGITPLLAMLKAHIARGPNCPFVYFVHCCRNRRLQPFRDELDELQKHPKVSILHIYDEPDDCDQLGVDFDKEGYLTVDALLELTADSHTIFGGKRVEIPWFECDVYMCGPPIFQEKVVSALVGAGANPDLIFTETFSPEANNQENQIPDSASVFFAESEVSAEWTSDKDMTLLELAESAGIEHSNACRMGVCMSCSARLREGTVYYEYNLSHPPDDNSVLLCSAKPSSDKIVIDI